MQPAPAPAAAARPGISEGVQPVTCGMKMTWQCRWISSIRSLAVSAAVSNCSLVQGFAYKTYDSSRPSDLLRPEQCRAAHVLHQVVIIADQEATLDTWTRPRGHSALSFAVVQGDLLIIKKSGDEAEYQNGPRLIVTPAISTTLNASPSRERVCH